MLLVSLLVSSLYYLYHYCSSVFTYTTATNNKANAITIKVTTAYALIFTISITTTAAVAVTLFIDNTKTSAASVFDTGYTLNTNNRTSSTTRLSNVSFHSAFIHHSV